MLNIQSNLYIFFQFEYWSGFKKVNNVIICEKPSNLYEMKTHKEHWYWNRSHKTYVKASTNETTQSMLSVVVRPIRYHMMSTHRLTQTVVLIAILILDNKLKRRIHNVIEESSEQVPESLNIEIFSWSQFSQICMLDILFTTSIIGEPWANIKILQIYTVYTKWILQYDFTDRNKIHEKINWQ